MVAPGRYEKVIWESIQRGTSAGESLKHAARAKPGDINTGSGIMLAANRLYPKDKRRPSRYITKSEPLVSTYTALGDFLDHSQSEDHRFNRDKYRRGIQNTRTPITVGAYIDECARLNIFDGTRWKQMLKDKQWDKPNVPKIERYR